MEFYLELTSPENTNPLQNNSSNKSASESIQIQTTVLID